ncbi:MAG: undecaprenyl-diphosphate phosphatase [Oscillospiraceae bacterium]
MGILEFFKVVFLGIVEGITEWLPISSTGHMILVDEFLKLNITPQFKEMFFVVIQLGAIMAVVLLFFHKLNPFAASKTKKEKTDTWQMWFKVLVAVLPAAIIGIPFDDFLDEHFYNFPVVALMLIVYGVWFIWVENHNGKKVPTINNINELTYKTAIFIGAFQVLALIPGTSRSGATIIGAMLLGCSRAVSAEFSFFLSIPVMFGASALKLVKYLFLDNGTFTGVEISTLAIGSIVAFVVSIVAIKFLMNFIKKHDFKAFGWYRIVLGAILLIYFVLRYIVFK